LSPLRFSRHELFDFGNFVDGKSLAVTRGGWRHYVVFISDLTAAAGH
jgi:hypothetical protein